MFRQYVQSLRQALAGVGSWGAFSGSPAPPMGGLSKRWIGEEKMALRAIARLKQLFPKRCPQPRRPATVVVADDRLHVAAHRGGPRYRRLRRGELPARERVRHACENATAAVARHTDASDTRSFWYRRWAGVMGGAGEPEKAPQEPKPAFPGENPVRDHNRTRASGVPVTTLSRPRREDLRSRR